MEAIARKLETPRSDAMRGHAAAEKQSPDLKRLGAPLVVVVGVLQLTLFLPENHSLKGKRQVLRAIKARVRTKFNVSIAESDSHDMWQRAELGICQVGNDRAFVDSALREVVNFIDALGLAPLGEERLEIINY